MNLIFEILVAAVRRLAARLNNEIGLTILLPIKFTVVWMLLKCHGWHRSIWCGCWKRSVITGYMGRALRVKVS